MGRKVCLPAYKSFFRLFGKTLYCQTAPTGLAIHRGFFLCEPYTPPLFSKKTSRKSGFDQLRRYFVAVLLGVD
jgi:hypothetical protein